MIPDVCCSPVAMWLHVYMQAASLFTAWHMRGVGVMPWVGGVLTGVFSIILKRCVLFPQCIIYIPFSHALPYITCYFMSSDMNESTVSFLWQCHSIVKYYVKNDILLKFASLCIIMLCLFTMHCSLRLIVRSELDVPAFATRHPHVCHHVRAGTVGEKCPGILPKCRLPRYI
jgi:hypothetical protein